MRLLVTVTVLYLVTSGVYSHFDQNPQKHRICPLKACIQSECPDPGFCTGGEVPDRCGCCTRCAGRKLQGEKCVVSEQCARGLECIGSTFAWLEDGTCKGVPDILMKKSCISNKGEVIQNGQSYTYMDDCRAGWGALAHKRIPCCRKCVCNHGVTSCHRNGGQCEGEKMKSCYHNGKEIHHDQSYTADCNSCYCYNGRSACTLALCPMRLVKIVPGPGFIPGQ